MSQHCHGDQRHLAAQLEISSRTLRRWKRNYEAGTLKVRYRGRRPCAVDVSVRHAVLAWLCQVGPAFGLPSLRAAHPQVRPVVLGELLNRYRSVWRARWRQPGYVLTWHRPGAVWAMDHTQACRLIAGQFQHLLAVRDLASHRQLAWRPVECQGSEDVVDELEQLIARYGAPLVIKSDNGSAFVADETFQLLAVRHIAPLFSPPGYPRYNGALERSNRTLKTLTAQQARAHGHALRWSQEDVRRARELSNTLARPWGHAGPSPDDAWQGRTPITAAERAEFRARLEVEREQALWDLGIDLQAELSHTLRARRDRLALERTLIALGYLSKRAVRRSPRLPKRHRKHHRRRELRRRRRRPAAAQHIPSSPARNSVPSAVNSAPSTVAQKSSCSQLASALTLATMRLLRAPGLPRLDPCRSATALPLAQREPAAQTWWRRAITPLFHVLKADKIMQ